MNEINPKAESSLLAFFERNLESNRQAMEKLGHPAVSRASKTSFRSTGPSTTTPANRNVTR